MTNRLPLLLGTLCVLAPSLAWGQDFAGRYALEGHYSNRRGTAVDLKIESTPGGLRVERTGRYTGRRHRDAPRFSWSSEDVVRRGGVLLVTYTVGGGQESAAGVSDALLNALDGVSSSASEASVADLLSEPNVFRAAYLLSSGGRLREYVANLTRRGDASWWRFVATRGERLVPRPVISRPPALRGTIRKAEWLEVDPRVIGDAFVVVIEEEGSGRRIGIYGSEVPLAFGGGSRFDPHVGGSLRVDRSALTPVTSSRKLGLLAFVGPTDAFYRLDGEPTVSR